MKMMKKWMIFEKLYLLYPPLDLNFAFWDRFQIESSLSGKNLDPIKGVLKVRQEFECKGVDLDPFSFVKFLAVFTVARLLFEPRKFFFEFFFYKSFFETRLNNFVVGEFFIAICLLIAFPLQSENAEIL